MRARFATGIKAVWRWQLKGLTTAAARGEQVDAGEVARLYSLLGEKKEVFAWLEKVYAAHDAGMPFIRVEPGFDNLHSDPRFQDLMRRANLPQN